MLLAVLEGCRVLCMHAVVAAMGLGHTQQTLVRLVLLDSLRCVALYDEPVVLCMRAWCLERIKEVLAAMGLSHTQQTLVSWHAATLDVCVCAVLHNEPACAVYAYVVFGMHSWCAGSHGAQPDAADAGELACAGFTMFYCEPVVLCMRAYVWSASRRCWRPWGSATHSRPWWVGMLPLAACAAVHVPKPLCCVCVHGVWSQFVWKLP
jgi:hypothetical protein